MPKLSPKKTALGSAKATKPAIAKNQRVGGRVKPSGGRLVVEKIKLGAKRERLEARLDAGQKALIERAAQLQGRSVTDFLLATVQEAAARVVREATVIDVSAEASRRFAAALLEPSPPNASMRRAARRHAQLIRA